jgi:GNAT superfamily N-acetyltransferase
VTDLVLRDARPGDAPLIHRFVAALAEYEKLAHEVEATPADIERTLFCEQPRVFARIAEWQGAPAGFSLWFYTYSTFQGRHGIWLEDIFVEPHLRGHGIGKALLADLARRCAAEDLGRLEWWVLDWNAPAIDFYQAQGAVLQDDWTKCRVTGEALQTLGQGA